MPAVQSWGKSEAAAATTAEDHTNLLRDLLPPSHSPSQKSSFSLLENIINSKVSIYSDFIRQELTPGNG